MSEKTTLVWYYNGNRLQSTSHLVIFKESKPVRYPHKMRSPNAMTHPMPQKDQSTGSLVFAQTNGWLVVWLPFFMFPYIGLLIIPNDELIFFRGVALAHQPDGDVLSSRTPGGLLCLVGFIVVILCNGFSPSGPRGDCG